MITRNIIVNQMADFKSNQIKSVRGLVTLNGETNISGTMRIFNVSQEILPIILAVRVGDKKFIFTDVIDAQDYNFKILGAPISEDIAILLAYEQDGEVRGIACGHNAGGKNNITDLFAEISDSELDKLIDSEMDSQDLKTLSNKILQEDEAELPEEKADFVENSQNFYSLIQPQLDELFKKFPHYKELEDLVQNTEWIKVTYTPDGKQHYILGKLFDGAMVTHLCYGIPAQSRSTEPPESLTEYCQWLPLNLTEPDSKGYWVMYQSAETGENIKM